MNVDNQNEPKKEQEEHVEEKQLTADEACSLNGSNDPSYTNLKLSYAVVCRQRYNRTSRKQKQQFIKELRRQEMLQSKALDGVRIYREFINPILEPLPQSEIIKLSPKDRFRLEEMLRE